jgi:hypothetical protein
MTDKRRWSALQRRDRIRQQALDSAYVVVRSDFLVEELSPDSGLLYFHHPLNANLSPDDASVGIRIRFDPKALTDSGRTNFLKDEAVHLTCLGKYVSWKNDSQLTVNPIVIW